MEALSWITPTKPSGSPIIRRSHSSTRVSSSVAAGEVCQIMHWAPSVAVSISASTEGGLELAGKKAKNPGCCQWVMPGTMRSRKSAKMRAMGSASSGGAAGSRAAISPGSTWALTG